MTDMANVSQNANRTQLSPGLPQAQGMYDPANEHDACGVGFIANIKGKRSHDIVTRGIDILCNLTHRGAVGADPLDGDGAGLMIQTPDAFYRAVVDFDLPSTGKYATGIVFLPTDDAARKICETTLNECIEVRGMRVLGWRDVPTDSSSIGRDARSVEPAVRQIFVNKGNVSSKEFNINLYVARKHAENIIREHGSARKELFYVNSLLAETVLYKGMLLSDQLATYYPDLADERIVSSIAFVHQRYSTNTFPTWDLAQPFRFVAHNGEINTLRGNCNRMRGREAQFKMPELGADIRHLIPAVIEGASDTSCFDNALELLTLTGRPLHHALAMMTPEAWATKASLDKKLKAFFEYHACMMEPWDGPANLVACNGKQIVAALDRNGLRPARYWVTDDDDIVYASEAGVLTIPEEKIVTKGRLAPGKMILIDTDRGLFLDNDEIKKDLAEAHPYKEWVDDNLIRFEDLPAPIKGSIANLDELRHLQINFGYTVEEMKTVLAPMCINGQEPIASMGIDTPLAVLSKHSKLTYSYFKQMFAQVTNPPIDPLREDVVMSLTQYIGSAGNLLMPMPGHCRMIELDQPILTNEHLEQLRNANQDNLKGASISMLFNAAEETLEQRIEKMREEAIAALDDGCDVLVLSDRGVNEEQAAVPSLLATSAVHHHLIRCGKRSQCSLIIESADAREVHHFALLFGYGATAVNPYLAFASIQEMCEDGLLPALDGNTQADEEEDAVRQYSKNYIKAIGKGLFKVFSKMGISTLQSYCSAQIFNAIGLSEKCINEYFTGTSSQVGGAGIAELHEETLQRHSKAFAPTVDSNRDIERGGEYHWRRDGEQHIQNPESIAVLQHACYSGDYKTFKKYTKLMNEQSGNKCTLRGLFAFNSDRKSIDISEVEPVSEIVKRFCTGAMSMGSISAEAHQTLAQAMNKLGGKSNTGEGGEDFNRFEDDRRSKIKQVASGRFGVTPHYLVNADELQIKMAQGAKPGEGGQLPGHKVSEYIGWLRYSVPGVTLISPPPHHDIYSIEDLAQLIYDLKNVNPKADIAVKLVSCSGVGTVAAGVSKGHAETVIIAGYDGGTGASPLSSIRHAGIPWEIGLADTHQTLLLNDLRGRIRVQTDGQLRTGRDVVIATLLGAEEYAFATVALMTMGCIMMRKCHLNTCPVGIATQDESLRKKFHGKPEFVINYFQFLAEEVREIMAELGYRTINEMIGRTDLMNTDTAVAHWKAQGMDYSKLLNQPKVGDEVKRYKQDPQDHGLESILDNELIKLAQPALNDKTPVTIDLPIKNFNRTACTRLSGEIATLHGREGLPNGTITINFTGIAGQSFGTFLANGINLNLKGEANDYVGKGMNGGRIVVRPADDSPLTWEENSIVGNTVLYGATGGEVYFAGRAGERFCVRNSGVEAVIEGVGDHGCEYMTGGLMICIGRTGRNFAAGMSGGFAFVLDEDSRFAHRVNRGMVDLEPVVTDEDKQLLRNKIEQHVALTGSPKGQRLLDDWETALSQFVKVFPHEYRRVLHEKKEAEVTQA